MNTPFFRANSATAPQRSSFTPNDFCLAPQRLQVRVQHLNVHSEVSTACWRAAVVLAFLLSLILNAFPRHLYAQQTTKAIPNPTLQEACGLDVMLVLDESGSIRDADAIGQVQDATFGFLEALADTGSQVALVEFNSTARYAIDYTPITSGADGALENVFRPYLDHNFDPPESPLWYTNWNDAMKQVALGNESHRADLVVFVTDGDPTAFNNEHPGSNEASTIEQVTYNTISTGRALTQTVEFANTVKNQGSRLVALGVGNALTSEDSRSRLKAISGPRVLGEIGTINAENLDEVLSADVILVEEFAELKTALRYLAFALCGPSLTVNKKVDRQDGRGYTLSAGWLFSAEASVNSTAGANDYSWITPDASVASGGTASGFTNESGSLNFKWKPNQKVGSSLTVTEADRIGFRFNNASCTVRSLENPEPRALNITVNGSTFSAPLGPTDIATCIVRNDLVSGSIAVDASPPHQLLRTGETATFDFVVRNIGTEPLSDVEISNSHCAAPVFTGGDSNGDNVLQTGETWRYICQTPNSQHDYTNLVTVNAQDPEGQPVEPAADQSVVQVMSPAIGLTLSPKLQYASVGSDARLAMNVTNTGDSTLYDVRVTSEQCDLVDYQRGDLNRDRSLQLGEVWIYDCVVNDITDALTVFAAADAEDENSNPVAPASDSGQINIHVDNVCNTGGFSGSLTRTKIFGVGMGDRHVTTHNPATIALPDADRVTGIYAQYAGRWRGQLPANVTFESEWETIRMTQQTSLNEENKVKLYTYETPMKAAEAVTVQVEDSVTNNWRTPRGAILYAQYKSNSEYYEVVRQINEQAYWKRAKTSHTEVVAIPPLAQPRTIYLTAVLIDNDPDDRYLTFKAAAGGVAAELSDNGPTHGENLSIYYIKLVDVPAGTAEVELTMISPPDVGDSLEWAGYALSFACTPDSDNDGVPDSGEDLNGDGDPSNDDSDRDGLPNFKDTDDDGDGTATVDEDANGNLDPEDDDADNDGIPDYLDGGAVPAPEAPPAPIAGADLTLIKSALSGPEALAGNRIEYSLVIKNNGPLAAESVEVEDLLPEGTSLSRAALVNGGEEGESSQETGRCVLEPEVENLLLCNLGTLVAGQTREISVIVDTNPAIDAGTLITNTARVTSATDDPAATNNLDSATVTLRSQAGLFIESTVSNPSPALGEEVVYTIQVRNNGPSVARGISVHQSLPQEVSFVRSSSTCALEEAELGLNYACALDENTGDTLGVGKTTSVEIRARVGEAALCGPAWESLAWVQAENMNGHAFADASLSAGCVADLRIFQFGNASGTLSPGQPVTLTFMLENLGPDAAQNVGLDGRIETDDAFDVLSVNPNVFGDRQYATCDLSSAFNILSGRREFHCELNDEFEQLDLDNGGGRWLVEVVVRSAGGGTLTTQAAALSATQDPNESNNSVTAESDPAILASVVKPLDTDGDAIPDYKDIDADNDGLTNAMEGDADTDGDSTPDFRDRDSDGDGIDDRFEGDVDTDSDGTPDFRDEDSDSDGIPDAIEGKPSESADGSPAADEVSDRDQDGTPDFQDADSDNDTIPDASEGNADTDGDGTPNFRDEDSDNDTIPDRVEGDVDSDGDGTPDYQDEDSDNDGTIDAFESVIDANHNGVPDYRDSSVQTNQDQYAGTLAAFNSRDSVSREGTVTITWQTFNEEGTTGFSVWRNQEGEAQVRAQSRTVRNGSVPGGAVKLTETPLAPKGAGSQYSYSDTFADPAAVNGQTFSYWLVEDKADGSTLVHGPKTVTVGAMGEAIFLPLLIK